MAEEPKLNQIDLLGGEGIVGEGRGTMEERFERVVEHGVCSDLFALTL